MTALDLNLNKVLAKAIIQKDAAAEDFVLGLEQKGFIRDFLNTNNPASPYTQMIDVAETGAGSITVKWDGADNTFVDKTELGNGTVGKIDQNLEALLWNKPVFKSEGMSAYDIKKGALNTLAYRMEKSLIKFTQESIKRAFAAMVTGGVAGATVTLADVADETKAKAQMRDIIAEATTLVKESQVTRDQVVITVEPSLFDNLAFAGLLGDRTTVTFAGGQYSVATMGGYRIQSGEMFLPQAGATLAAADIAVIIGTSNSVVSKVDVVAANTGKLGISNDLGTYIEVADINVVPTFADKTHAKLIRTMAFA